MPVAVDVIPASSGRPAPVAPEPRQTRAPWWARPVGPVLAIVGLATWITLRASVTYRGKRYFMLFDDAMISMRYARNLAEGHGLVFNAGQTPVEGYTNFLWTLWMSALHLLPVPTRFVPALVAASGAALVAVTVVLIGRIARAVAARDDEAAEQVPMIAALAMWGVALWYPLVWWSVRGLEPGLLAAVLASSIWLALRIDADGVTRGRVVGLCLVLAAGVLTRTDFAVVVPALLLWLGWRRGPARRAALIAGVAVVGALVAHTAFRVAYYGEMVPNTYVLKIEGVPLWDRLDRGLGALGATLVAELAVLVVFGAIACWRRRRDRATWLLVPPILAAAAYSAWVGGDAWEWVQSANRFVTPVGPLLFVLAALGVADVVRLPARRQVVALGMVAVVALAAVAIANRLTPTGDIVRVSFNLADFRTLHWLALGAFVALVLGAILIARTGGRRPLAFLALGVGMIVLVAMPAWIDWARSNGALVTEGQHEVRVGLGLRDAVVPGHEPSIAIVAAGNIPYWSMLPTVDVLGKVDPVIAHRPARSFPFTPGHNKWDYRYSVCRLRPDVVVQLWEPEVAEIQAIERCGYTNNVAFNQAGDVTNYYLVRNGQTGFDPVAMRKAIFGAKARARI